ncbi:hypothetical protein Bca52824_078595 [Brassica carinata]|uniref:Uncharacterized protein n=1 Tax=Brassica carinata TaxID=52824 RepID=A0A8X7PW20_BRACI|nr:hypothetical protein Bca52824_078595 [Brassica carinata]
MEFRTASLLAEFGPSHAPDLWLVVFFLVLVVCPSSSAVRELLVKVEKLRKESETGSDFSNKMTALCLLNIQRQRMLHEEALGLEMKKVLSKHKR